MLNSIRKRLKLLLAVVITLLPLIIVARIFIVVRYIDPNTLFYEQNTVVPDVFHWVVYVLTFAVLLSGFLFRLRFASAGRPRLKRRVQRFSEGEGEFAPLELPPREEPVGLWRHLEKRESLPALGSGTRLVYENTAASTVFASTLAGLIFVASGILTATGMIVEKDFGAVGIITLILAVFSGIFFILAGMKRVYPYSKAFGYLSLFPSLWCVFRLIGDFLDLSQNSNEYSHVLQIICLCLLTVFFFNEGKFTLISSSYYNFGLYLSSALASLLIISAVSIPNLLLASFWMVSFDGAVFNSLLEFTVGIYIIAKLFSIVRKLEKMSESDVLSA